jgi:hypothetical protein
MAPGDWGYLAGALGLSSGLLLAAVLDAVATQAGLTLPAWAIGLTLLATTAYWFRWCRARFGYAARTADRRPIEVCDD